MELLEMRSFLVPPLNPVQLHSIHSLSHPWTWMSDGCGALCNSTGCASIKLALVKCSAQNFPIILNIVNGTLESNIFEFSIHLSASSLGIHSTWEGTTFAIVLDARNTKDKGNFLVVQRLSLHASMAGVQFWSLVKELRSLMPCGTVKEKKRKEDVSLLSRFLMKKSEIHVLF